DKALKAQKISTPVTASSASPANIFGVSVRKLASKIRDARPVSLPAAPATISAVTAAIRLRPPEIFSPAMKYGKADGTSSSVNHQLGANEPKLSTSVFSTRLGAGSV